jgi:hypothetical protein
MEFQVISRKEDGYINLTSLCKAGNKHFKNWKQNAKTEAFLTGFNFVMLEFQPKKL